MTKANKDIIKKAIADSNLKGYKWTVTENGIRWSYGVDFELIASDYSVMFEGPGCVYEVVFVVQGNETWLVDNSHDFVETFEDALYWATRKTIVKANRMF